VVPTSDHRSKVTAFPVENGYVPRWLFKSVPNHALHLGMLNKEHVNRL
jgi:hypothetical protein